MEAVGHAGICLGILANDGIVLAAERRNTNKLLDEVFVSEKIYKLHKYVFKKFVVCRMCERSSVNYVVFRVLNRSRHLAIDCHQLWTLYM